MSDSPTLVQMAPPRRPPSGESVPPSGAEWGERRPTARDVMSLPVTSVREATPITMAAALLASRGFAGVPVVDGADHVIGLVTEADLVRDQLRPSRPGPTTASPGRTGAAVGEVMSRTPLLAPRDYDLAELVALMLAAGTNTVPIVEDGRLVGVVEMRSVLSVVGSGHPL